MYYIYMFEKETKNLYTNESALKGVLAGLFSRNEVYFGTFFIVFFLITFTLFYALGFMPKEFASSAEKPTLVAQIQEETFKEMGISLEDSTSENTPNASIKTPSDAKPLNTLSSEKAVRIEASTISLNATIYTPASNSYNALNTALTKGAVYYPGSGNVLAGNMFIFGHSTSFKIVNNPAYKIFNNIKSLKTGDEINVYTANKKYTYIVTNVKLVDSREAMVDFKNTGRMLTLSTCNSFGQKSDRYVVEAIFDHELDI